VLADHLVAIADLREIPLRPDFLLYLGDGLEIRRCFGHLLPISLLLQAAASCRHFSIAASLSMAEG
jgi:hypothetical protein